MDRECTTYRVIDHGDPNVVIRTDASNNGWGAIVNGITTGGRWSATEVLEHINYLELLAAFFGLKSLCSAYRDSHVRIELDNSTAVCYINSMGGTVSTRCNEVAKEIWDWCIERRIWLSASHIPGRTNVEADLASRKFDDRTEWQLKPKLFSDTIQRFKAQVNIDLFATRLNAQLPRYVAWQPDPSAEHIDAFTLNWSRFNAYLFPPFSLVNRCVQKIALDGAKCLIIVPLWPNQCWFTPLMDILIDYPLIMPKTCLIIPETATSRPPLHVRLMACLVSGRSTEAKDFRKKLPESSSLCGKPKLDTNMTEALLSGKSFVTNGRSISLRHLYHKY